MRELLSATNEMRKYTLIKNGKFNRSEYMNLVWFLIKNCGKRHETAHAKAQDMLYDQKMQERNAVVFPDGKYIQIPHSGIQALISHVKSIYCK